MSTGSALATMVHRVWIGAAHILRGQNAPPRVIVRRFSLMLGSSCKTKHQARASFNGPRGIFIRKKRTTAPGPSEINEAKDIDAIALLDNGRALDISQLTSLIKGSSFVVANDTGPAHITAHVGAKGLTLFGKHTTAHKVSIERENFKAIEVTDLNNLSAEKVFERLSNSLS